VKYILLVIAFIALPIQAKPLKIASWNIAWLGSHKFNKRTPDDYAQLAKYAARLDADVIALQEVENGKWASKVFGDEYDYYFSTRDYVQRVGVAVKKSSGYKVLAQEYNALDVGHVRYGMDITLTKEDKSVRLLAVHLKSGCFEKGLIAEDIAAIDNERTQKACTKLVKQIPPLEAWIDQRAQENTPFMVIGDFNRRFAIDIDKSYQEEQGLWQAIDDEATEDLWTPTLTKNSKCWGGYYKDYIDHIVLDPRARSKLVDGSFEQLVYDGKYSKQLSRALSDHCPISVGLAL